MVFTGIVNLRLLLFPFSSLIYGFSSIGSPLNGRLKHILDLFADTFDAFSNILEGLFSLPFFLIVHFLTFLKSISGLLLIWFVSCESSYLHLGGIWLMS